MPPGIVKLGIVSCFIRNAGRTEEPDEEALLSQPPRLAVNDPFQASERLVAAFDMIVGPSLDFDSVAARSFNVLLTEWAHHSRTSHFA